MINKVISLESIEYTSLVRFNKHILMVFPSPFDFPQILEVNRCIPHYFVLDEVQYEGNLTYCTYKPSSLALDLIQDSKVKFDIVVIE